MLIISIWQRKVWIIKAKPVPILIIEVFGKQIRNVEWRFDHATSSSSNSNKTNYAVLAAYDQTVHFNVQRVIKNVK